MKKIPKKENFFRNLIKNKIFIENYRKIMENYRKLQKTIENYRKLQKTVELACARLAHVYYFPRCRNRNRSHNPYKTLTFILLSKNTSSFNYLCSWKAQPEQVYLPFFQNEEAPREFLITWGFLP